MDGHDEVSDGGGPRVALRSVTHGVIVAETTFGKGVSYMEGRDQVALFADVGL